MDQPQDVHSRMLHEVSECIKHHKWDTRICAECIRCFLHGESKEEDDDVQTVITQVAALTTQSQLMATTMAETSASVAAAINQLNANQQAMQQQFAAFTTQRNTTYQPAPTMQHPLTWPRSIQQEGEGADVENMGVVGPQTLCTQEVKTREPHSQIL